MFTDPTDSDYDMILLDVKKINKKNILEARKLRAERLSKLAHEAAVLATGEKQKADQFEIKLSKITAAEVIFRVMTWEHIPVDDVKTQKAKNTAKNKNNTVFDYPPSPKDFFNLSSSIFFLIKYRSW